jgi:hypothetical protein
MSRAPVCRIDIGRGAALDPLDHLQPQRPTRRQLLSDEIELGPGASPSTMTLPRKRSGSTGRADPTLQIGDAGEVDDRDEALERESVKR